MTDTITPNTEAGVIAALAAQASGGSIVTGADGRSFLVTPKDTVMTEITDPHGLVAAPPSRVRQRVTLQTVDSLVDYVNRFSNDDTLLFADIQSSSITALIDYHKPLEGELPPEAGFLDHRANLSLPFSEEWKTWTGIDGKMLDQLSFARFLEENAVDIVAPTGADLLEVCRDLQAVRKVDFRKAVRTNTDNENFEYVDETQAKSASGKGSIEVPSKFQLNIPVYFGGESVTLFAFLRWRLVETSLQLGIQLHRAEHVRQAVFKEIVADAASRTDRAALFGATS